MKEPVLYDPETDTLLVEIRPWPGASPAEINEEVGGEDAEEGLVVHFGPDSRTEERTDFGGEVEEALHEVLAHVRGEVTLPTRIVEDPSKMRIVAVRKKLGLSRRQFAERYHLDPRTVQDWEQGRRTPDQAARVLLTVIEREPEAVQRALTSAE